MDDLNQQGKGDLNDVDRAIEGILYQAQQITGDTGQIQMKSVMKDLKPRPVSEALIDPIFRKLLNLGLIERHPENKQLSGYFEGAYRLTEKGWQFESFENEKKKKKLPLEQVESVIDTNRAVKTNIVWTLLFAATSTAFIAITAWLQYRDKTEQEIKLLRQQIKSSLQSLDSIELSLQRIDSSIKNFVVAFPQTKDTTTQ